MDIKRAIKANGLTVKEVAERMGITPVGLSQHINGAPQPTNTITCPHCGKPIKIEKGE